MVLRKHGLRAWEDTQLFSLKEDETVWVLNLFLTCKIMRNARIILNFIAIDEMIWFFLSLKFPAVSLQNLLHFAAVQRTLPTFLNGFHSTCGIRIFIGFLESFISYSNDCRLCLSSKKYFERKRQRKLKIYLFVFLRRLALLCAEGTTKKTHFNTNRWCVYCHNTYPIIPISRKMAIFKSVLSFMKINMPYCS